MIVTQFGYPTLTSPPIGLDVDDDGVGLDVDGGILTEAGHPGWFGGTHSDRPRFYPVSRVIGKWVEVVLGVKWTVDNTGWIVFATRCKENGESGFTTHYNQTGIPTYQQMPGNPWKSSAMDKNGTYIGTASGSAPPASWSVQTDLRGLTRHPSRADAELALSTP